MLVRFPIRCVAAALLVLLVVVIQGPLLRLLTPAEHGGVIAADVIGRVAALVVTLFVTGGATAATSAVLGLVMGGEEPLAADGCLATLGLVGLGTAAVFMLTFGGVVLSWRLDHDLFMCLVVFIVALPTTSAIIGGQAFAEAIMGLIGLQ